MEYIIIVLIIIIVLLIGQVSRYMNIVDAQHEMIIELNDEIRNMRESNT